jgi:dTMP kinase
VVSDRWYHSSLAYQGTEEDQLWVRELNRRARRPDLTVFLEVAPEVAAERRAAADRSEEIFDRLAVQHRVAEGYRQVIDSLRESERIEVVDGELPAEDVAARIAALARETCLRAGMHPPS